MATPDPGPRRRGRPVSPFAVGQKVTLDADQLTDPIPVCMQRHVLVSQADSGTYLVVLPGQPRQYGPYAESRLTPGWGMPHA